MKKLTPEGFRIPALVILATIAFGSASAQDAPEEKKEIRVKIISTVDGKTTITDTTLATTGYPNDIRKILGDKHPFFYKDMPYTSGCRRPEPTRPAIDDAGLRKNTEQRTWMRDSTVQRVWMNAPAEPGAPAGIEKLHSTREVEIVRSPAMVRLEKDAGGKVKELRLDGNPMEMEKLIKERGLEPGTTFFRSTEPDDAHRFTIISRDSLHSLDTRELRMFKSSETGNSRVIVLMKVEKPEAKELEELKDQNENIPTPKRELEADNLNLYPNPSSGRFTLSFGLEDKGTTNIRIYNETGREVFSEQVKGLKGTYSKDIDLTGNPQGVYFVQVTQGKKGFTRKVILQ